MVGKNAASACESKKTRGRSEENRMTVAEEPKVTFDLSPATMHCPEKNSADNIEATSFSEPSMERFNSLIASMELT